MLSIMKNDWNRLMQQKMYVVVAIVLTICSVALAIVLTGKMKPKLNLAVVGEGKNMTTSDQLRITRLEKEPEESALVQKQYDAIVLIKEDGSYQIKSEQGKEFNKELEAVLKGQEKEIPSQSDGRRIGTNIIGYMLMFLLMQGALYARLFTEDKEKHQMERVACSPLSFWKYLVGHGIFMWLFICVPSFLIIAVASLTRSALGFALWQYALLLGLIGVLAVSLALCINSFFDVADTANMIATSIIVFSSVLGGSFYDMSNGSDLIGKILYVLPQKGLLLFIDAWERHNVYFSSMLGLAYVIIVSVVFISIGVIKTRKNYRYHRS